MKEKINNIFMVMLFVAVFGYVLISGILDLTNRKDLHTIRIDYGFEVLEVQHSINGLIPYGKDHYYIGIDGSTYNAYIIRAPKDWAERNFGEMTSENGTISFDTSNQITGLSKKISNYKISRKISSQISTMEGMTFPLGTDCFLELSYARKAWAKILSISLIILLVFIGFLIFKKKIKIHPNLVIVYFIVIVISLFLVFIAESRAR